MSKRTDAKKARRRKRQAARDRLWLPEERHQELTAQLDEVIGGLEDFAERLAERGWEYSEDPDDEVGVVWYWPPSFSDVEDPDESVAATVVALLEAEGGEIAHVVFVGTDDDYQFDLDELFDHIEQIEAYRSGDPLPTFADA
ncbi:hypothetical protein [Mycobacterium sp. E740]|uniref:hypothetical protein n=1 Tax=Mycobacterium sp. E740 TaxID=1834149 RepID=UPI0008009859|nr:hypothetical protein [Mycobacterium sp. E740]OBI80754.1 hypothetical protein A5663_17360 [Mycobacterium sp. E740]